MGTPASPDASSAELADLRKRVGVLTDAEAHWRHDRLLHQACDRVRGAVSQMASPSDVDPLLASLRDALQVLEIPHSYWGINVVGSTAVDPVLTRSMGPSGASRRREAPNALVWSFWQAGRPVYRPDLLEADDYDELKHLNPPGAGPDLRSVLDIPYSHGTLAVSGPEKDPYSDVHVGDLQSLATVVGEGYRRLQELQVLEERNQQLHDALAQRQADQILRDAVWHMDSSADVPDLLDALGQALTVLEVPFHQCGISFVDEDRDPPVTLFGRDPDGGWGTTRVGVHVVESIWRGQVPVYRRDLHQDDPYLEFDARRQRGGVEVRAILDVPFASGTIAVNSLEPGVYTDRHTEMLWSLGQVLEDGLQRIDDLEATESASATLDHQLAQHEALRLIRDGAWSMRSTRDVPALLQAVAAALHTLELPFFECGVNIVDPARLPVATRYVLPATGDWQVMEGPDANIEMFWQSGEPVYRPDIQTDDPHGEAAYFSRSPRGAVRSILDVPFDAGTLALNSTEPHAYTDEHIAQVQELARAVGEGFRRLQDLRDLETRNRELETEAVQRQLAESQLKEAHDLLEARVRTRTSELAAANATLQQEIAQRQESEVSLQDSLRFESVLSRFSSRFMDLSPEGIDEGIDEALEWLGGTLEADRAAFEQYSDDRSQVLALHEWCRDPRWARLPGRTPTPTNSQPWAFARLLGGHTVSVASLDQLPPEAVPERQYADAVGLQATLVVPVSVSGQVAGQIRADMYSRERRWSDDDEARLRLLGEIFGSALQRQTARRALEERLQFQRLLTDISGRFVNMPVDSIDSEIHTSLRRLGEHLDVDLCELSRFSDDMRHLHLMQTWSTAFVRPDADGAVRVTPVDEYRWSLDKVCDHQCVEIARIADLPDEAARERRYLEQTGARSALIVPVHITGSVAGMVLLTSGRREAHWDDELISRVQLLADILGNAMHRREVQQELEERLRFQLLLADISGRFVNIPVEDIDTEIESSLRRLGEHYDIDFCEVSLFSDNQSCLLPTHVWHTEAGAPLGSMCEPIPRDDFPWYFDQLVQGQSLRVSQISDLPEQAGRERARLETGPAESLLLEPLSALGEVIGAIYLASVAAQRHWSDELVTGMQLLAGVVGNALLRKRHEADRSRLVEILETTTDLVGTADIHGRIVYLNRAGRGLLGIEDLDGLTIEQTADPEEAASFAAETMPAVLRDGVWRGEVTLRARDGRRIPVSEVLIGHRSPDGGFGHVTAIARDITEWKRAEEAVRRSEESYRLLLSSLHDVVYTVDAEGRVTFVSEQVRQYGYEPDEILGSRELDFVHPADRAMLDRQLCVSLSGGDPPEIEDGLSEFRVLTRDGQSKWVQERGRVMRNAAGDIIGLSGVIRDISESKRAERTLRDERDRAQSYLDIAEVMLLALDDQGRIVLINRRGQRLLGYTEQQLVGRDWFETCIPPEQRDEIASVFGEIMAGRLESTEYYENEVITRAGERRVVAWHNALTRNAEGAITGVLSSGEDITERRAAEEARALAEVELEEQRALAVRADRLRSLGEMAAGIAHELNQPLVGVRGLAEHMLIGLDRGWEVHPDKFKERTASIVRQADRMTHIIDHVRNFSSQAGRRDRVPVDMNEIVQSAADLVGAQFRSRGLALKLELTPGLPPVHANFFSVEEVVLNLLNNSRDALDDATRRDQPPAGEVLARTTCLGDVIQLELRDTGPGIPADILDRIFEPFYTTKDPNKGTGLGLSICRSIVEDLGGSIAIASTGADGTTVLLSLPCAARDGANASESAP